jgi:hypothetical protein
MGTPADAGDALAAQGHTPCLPEPTGPCPVGTTSLRLTDSSRPDPWAAGVNARELMVSLWYPAAPSNGRRALYMTPAESELQLTSRGITGVPPGVLAMAGHSIGGAAAIAALLADSRIRAGIDMDGTTHAQIPDDGLSRPFLFLGKPAGKGIPGKPGGPASTWERDWKLLTGWKRWLQVAGAIHASFTDLALLADQVGIDTGAGLPGSRSLDITRAYVRAFFDQHLRGKPQALLDQPSPRYPEVTFKKSSRT